MRTFTRKTVSLQLSLRMGCMDMNEGVHMKNSFVAVVLDHISGLSVIPVEETN